jgi:allantoicase
MKKAEFRRCAAVLLFALCGLFLMPSAAKADDFGKIVNRIEADYHVHRNYRFVMAVAGLAVKCSHVAGVKVFKAALFENQHLDTAVLDDRLDETVEHADAAGWRPLVKSVSHRSGEHTYIYARAKGEDMELLLVSVEPGEAVVLQVKLNPAKLSHFINEHTRDDHGD